MIEQVTEHKRLYLDLLLMADEQESMIDRYLDIGEMYLLCDEGSVKAVCVVTDQDDGVCELKNIAVVPEARRKGYGKTLIAYLISRYSEKYREMIVGTGDVPAMMNFYTSCGFVYSHRVVNFFTDHYDHPMIEDGILLTDMIYLKNSLR